MGGQVLGFTSGTGKKAASPGSLLKSYLESPCVSLFFPPATIDSANELLELTKFPVFSLFFWGGGGINKFCVFPEDKCFVISSVFPSKINLSKSIIESYMTRKQLILLIIHFLFHAGLTLKESLLNTGYV